MQTKSKKILIILSIIILIGLLFLGIYLSKKQKNNIELKNKSYYEVTLNPNIYFPNDKIKADNYYIASSIKSIDIYFNYYLKNKTKENINYSYDITATLKSYADNGTKLVWTKDFILKKVDNLNRKEIKIKEKYNLDYQNYVNYIKSFQEYYHIKTESYLYVKLNIKTNDEDNTYVLLTIPINENVIEITMKENNSFLEDTKNIDINQVIIFIIIVMILGIFLSKKILKKDNEEAMLKEYQDIIITIKTKPNLNSNNIIYLSKLKDLINIAVNNNINIFNYRNNYYTIIDNTYYSYILRHEK